MADSTTNLDTIAVGDSGKEVTLNELVDAGSMGTLFGRHASACAGLTWGYYGGRLWDGSAATAISNGTLTLTNTATNYVEATNAGVVSSNTSAFTAGRIRIAKVVCSGGAVTSYEDHRTYTFPAAAGLGSVTSVNITQPAAGITASGGPITSSGSITLALANDLAGLEGLGSNGMAARTGTSTWAVRTITAPAAGITVSDGDGVSGNPTLVLANDLAGLEGLSSNGMAARTGTSTWTVRTITAPAAGITVSNGDGVSGNPTLVLANDLAALEGLSTSGFAKRTGTDTWAISTNVAASDFASQSANTVLAGPTSGGSSAPTFRAAVYADLPTGVPGKPRVDTHTYASTVTLDCSAYDVFEITLTGNITITFSNGTDGQRVLVRLTQDGTGSRLVTWDSGVSFGSDIATAVATTTASKVDYFGLSYNSTASKYHMIAVARGY